MKQTLIKVYDPEYLLFDSSQRVHQLVRMDFQSYLVKYELHKLSVLENENLILFSLLYDKCDYELNEKELIISIYAKNKNKQQQQQQQQQSNKDKESKHTIIAIKCADRHQMGQLSRQLHTSSVFTAHMGPLSYQPSRKERTSLLSTESPEQNFRGMVNLALLILIANHIRLVLENFRKYGILLKNILYLRIPIPGPSENPQFLAIFSLLITTLLAYLITYQSFKNKWNPKFTRWLNVFNILLTFILPSYFIQGCQPFLNLILLGFQCTISMKLISYAHFMRNAYFFIERIKEVENKKLSLKTFFNENEIDDETLILLEKHAAHPIKLIDFKHFLYFMVAPTLCFQFTYVRSPTIRKIWLLKRLAEYTLIIIFQIIIWFQYVEPLVENTHRMLKEDKSFIVLLDRILKLAIPNTYLWIATFLGGFQCWLNILAELLRFADRQFYKDWWNCKNLEQYWRLWNLPVHHWLLRHLYFPCLKQGLSKQTANVIVFLISALAHEYIISSSLGIVEFTAFFGMMVQAPVIMIQKKIEKIFQLQDSQLGNLMFWCTFCFIGQPLMIFVYYFRYLEKVTS